MQYNTKFTLIHLLSYAPCITYQIQIKHWDGDYAPVTLPNESICETKDHSLL